MCFRRSIIYLLLLITSSVGLISCEDESLESLLEDGLPDREAVVHVLFNGELMEFASFEFSYQQHEEQIKEYLGWEISMFTQDRDYHAKISIYPAELNLGSYNFNDLRYNFELQHYTFYNDIAEKGEKFIADQGYFKILSIDYEKRKMSGIFVARLYNEDRTEFINLRGGSFTNVYFNLN